MPWNPDCYRKFQTERFAPFEDLFRLLNVRDGMKVVDLGCGTGELTRQLADRLPGSDVLGMDKSPEMLSRAQEQARAGLRFELGDIETMSGEWDLVFSHAVIHWVDNHHSLVPRLLSLVRPGGQLAAQLPSNFSHPTHTLITETAREEPFRTALNGWTRTPPVLSIDAYAELLYAHSATDITVFEKIYPHVLEDADALAEWNRGTALVPYFERLPQELREPFLERYRAKLRQRWTTRPAFYAFRRTLFVATRPPLDAP
jgi:trans-aconitate 2-methyltransferase